ncbi:MAG: ABC transporter substrate-binding protein, partial [Chloroflexi bacterium]|nr:ABC transporter substrate-binding protein [Chloroflexota bacterium]
MPLTGSLANIGKDNEDGMNVFMASVGNTVSGRKVELTFVDSQGQPDAALTKARELVDNQHVNLLMGFNNTPECTAAAQYIQTAHVPLIVSSNCGAQTLMTDARFKSPYLIRLTQTATQFDDPAADWAYKNGKRKAIIIASDYGGGTETSDLLGSAFVQRGGAIVQEMHPPLGTTDFGPFLAQLSADADVLFLFTPGIDSLRFVQQYGTYASNKLQIVDISGATFGPNLAQLKDQALGLVGSYPYSEAYQAPENATMLAAFHKTFPDRVVSGDFAQGYSAAQVVAADIQKINGRVEQTQDFLNALYATDVQTAKGEIKLDQDHDIVENAYIWLIE